MLHFKAVLAAVCLLGLGAALISVAKATEVAGSFEGTIYSYNGNVTNIAVAGTISYNTSLYQSEYCGSYCSIFAPISNDAISITETSDIGTLIFNSAGNHGFFIETFQINIGADAPSSSSYYTELDMIFQNNVFVLGDIPTSFSGAFAPYQGSSETYFNNGESYNFYITQVDVRAVPEPSTWTTMLIGFAGLGYTGYRKGIVFRA